jgi:actin-related protein 2
MPKLRDLMISDQTIAMRSYLDLSLPVEQGIVQNWDDEQLVLDYIFKHKLAIDPADHPLLIAEAPLTLIADRKKMLEIFYEVFGFKQLRIDPQALLALYAHGLVTGLVVDSGECVTHITPIVDSWLLRDLIGCMDLAGRGVTESLAALLLKSGYTFQKTSDFDDLREIKEKLCFVSADIELDRKIARETTAYAVPYRLQDGRVIKVDDVRFEAPEALFHPQQLNIKGKGLSELIYDTVMKVNASTDHAFLEFGVLTGGTSMLPGFFTRIDNDFKKLVLAKISRRERMFKHYKLHIDDTYGTGPTVYHGAAFVAKLSAGKAEGWVHKDEYQSNGSDAISMRWQSVGQSVNTA